MSSELALAVDDDVVAGRAVVVAKLDAPGLRRDDALAAVGDQVLALVVAAGAEAVAVGVAAAHGEDAVGALGNRHRLGLARG